MTDPGKVRQRTTVDPDPAAPVPMADDVEVSPPYDRRTKPPAPEVLGESPESSAIRRLAVLGIVLIAVIAILGDVYLLSSGHAPPAGLIAIGSAGVGALATLLAVRSR